MESYNKEKYRLGKLCPNRHEYASTGMSLRYNIGGGCVQCCVEKSTQYRLKHPGSNKQYYIDNKKRVLKTNRKYYQDNKIICLKRCRETRKKGSKSLSDSYIKIFLREQFGLISSDIPPELIIAKREQLQLTRARRRVQNEFNHQRNCSIG